jgi:2-methylcitrate dehydratase PrpD
MRMTALNILGTWAAQCGKSHGIKAYEIAAAAVVDTMACMLAGAPELSAEIIRKTIATWGSGPCRIAGGSCSSAPFAALANGAAAQALDFDDNDTPAASHPSAVLLPAILAVAEQRSLTVDDALDAYIVGLEVMGRVGEAVNMIHYAKGWHATATIGSLGAAAACGRLMKLDPRRMKAAISIATSTASGYKVQFGTLTKPLHSGLAAKSGVIAASLAEAGMTASDEVLDGKWSFLSLLAGEGAPGFQQLAERVGQPLAITQYGLSLKRYPCCYYTARCVDAMIDLREEHGLKPADVDHIVAELSDRNASILRYPRPEDNNEAKFSLPYCVAQALFVGQLRLKHFLTEVVIAPEIRAFLPRVEVRTYPARADSPDLSADEPDTVTVYLKSGDKVTKTTEYARGSARRPFTPAELMGKFRDCAAWVLDPASVDRATALIGRLTSLGSVKELTDLFTWSFRPATASVSA